MLGFNSGPPMDSRAYNNNMQLVQGPGYVAILNEMVHNVRIIPLDGRPHFSTDLKQWVGDSRGRWEGNTLVVDTVNFYNETSLAGKPRASDRIATKGFQPGRSTTCSS